MGSGFGKLIAVCAWPFGLLLLTVEHKGQILRSVKNPSSSTRDGVHTGHDGKSKSVSKCLSWVKCLSLSSPLPSSVRREHTSAWRWKYFNHFSVLCLSGAHTNTNTTAHILRHQSNHNLCFFSQTQETVWKKNPRRNMNNWFWYETFGFSPTLNVRI